MIHVHVIMSVAPPSNTSTSFLILFFLSVCCFKPKFSESLPTRNCNFGGTQIVITDLSNNIFYLTKAKSSVQKFQFQNLRTSCDSGNTEIVPLYVTKGPKARILYIRLVEVCRGRCSHFKRSKFKRK